jgi:hypothetical protein
MEKLLEQPTISFDELIKRLNLPSKFDFKPLKNVLDGYGIEIKNSVLRGDNLALTTLYNHIHFNISKLNFLIDYKYINGDDLFFLIAHELCHYIRINKYGFDFHLTKLKSKDLEEFSTYLITEEIICDRFSKLFFYNSKGFMYNGPFNRNLIELLEYELYKKKLFFTHEKFLEYNLDYDKIINDYFILIKRD